MKVLRSFALMIVVGVFPVFMAQASAQFEVSPDHFEQPSVAATKSHNSHRASASTRHHSHPVNMASRHSGSKLHHHHSHAAA